MEPNPPPIDDALLAVLRCPVSGEPLRREDDRLVTGSGRAYDIVDGLPVLIPQAATGAGDQPAATGSAGMS
ncbi:MAG: hypothetical protein LAT64_12570 [Phycisphaerales bacterium]|nr:hypothetical protein [Planctomycetota bacterium]MCH8509588.1 hypothetical protein [Phycisphaerales bacterium]